MQALPLGFKVPSSRCSVSSELFFRVGLVLLALKFGGVSSSVVGDSKKSSHMPCNSTLKSIDDMGTVHMDERC